MAASPSRIEAQSAKRAAVEAGVLGATERLLAEGASYADLSVDRIAREAGISRTAFYFYFRDKRELLTRLTGDVADRLYTLAEGWWSDEGAGPERLAEAIGAIVALYREHGVVLRAVVEASTYDEGIAEFWRAVVDRFVEATRVRVEAEQRAGGAAGRDPAATAFALAWMTERAVYQHLVRDRPTADDAALVQALAGIWVRSIYA